MFYEEIRTKQDLSYISICSLSILFNSKFFLMATCLETNVVVGTRVQCSYAKPINMHVLHSYTVDSRYLEFQGTLKYFEISVVRHIRFAELRKK